MPALNPLRRPVPALLALALLAAGLGLPVWLQQDKHLQTLVQQQLRHVSDATGFRLQHIALHGNQRMARAPLVEALALRHGEPLALIDLPAAQARLESLEWVAAASLRRIFPATIEAHIREEQPFALWQRGGHLFLVNRQAQAFLDLGAAVDNQTWEALDDFAHLPWLVGVGALEHGVAFLQVLDSWPALQQKLRAATWMSGRRWDLHLAPDIRARLPEDGVHVALARLQRLHEDHDIFNRDIRVIDLRLADRIGFRLGETAAMPEVVDALPEAPNRPPGIAQGAAPQDIPQGDG